MFYFSIQMGENVTSFGRYNILETVSSLQFLNRNQFQLCITLCLPVHSSVNSETIMQSWIRLPQQQKPTMITKIFLLSFKTFNSKYSTFSIFIKCQQIINAVFAYQYITIITDTTATTTDKSGIFIDVLFDNYVYTIFMLLFSFFCVLMIGFT